VAAVTRRTFLASVSTALPALAAPAHLFALPASRQLRFTHTHTHERLSIEYFTGGQYHPGALASINYFLRDFRTGSVHDIDPALLDLLTLLSDRTSSREPYQVISGYRSPATNAMLRQKSEHVAAGSLHLLGQAIDIRLADVPLGRLRDAALAIRAGGVGYYPGSNFVHVDTGRVRSW
jgi:uncharacterized protein YcbK (DUF882 family)